jgi:hypothetical protein
MRKSSSESSTRCGQPQKDKKPANPRFVGSGDRASRTGPGSEWLSRMCAEDVRDFGWRGDARAGRRIRASRRSDHRDARGRQSGGTARRRLRLRCFCSDRKRWSRREPGAFGLGRKNSLHDLPRPRSQGRRRPTLGRPFSQLPLSPALRHPIRRQAGSSRRGRGGRVWRGALLRLEGGSLIRRAPIARPEGRASSWTGVRARAPSRPVRPSSSCHREARRR